MCFAYLGGNCSRSKRSPGPITMMRTGGGALCGGVDGPRPGEEARVPAGRAERSVPGG
jgi:hypothetical protein